MMAAMMEQGARLELAGEFEVFIAPSRYPIVAGVRYFSRSIFADFVHPLRMERR
jgi:hypothetical protein